MIVDGSPVRVNASLLSLYGPLLTSQHSPWEARKAGQHISILCTRVDCGITISRGNLRGTSISIRMYNTF